MCVCSRSFDSTASGAAARKQSHRFMLFYCHFPFASFHLFILAECQQISLPVEERSAVAAFHLIFFLLWRTRMGKKMAIVTATHKHTRAHHVKRSELRAGARCLVGRTERGEIAGLVLFVLPRSPTARSYSPKDCRWGRGKPEWSIVAWVSNKNCQPHR